MNLGMKTALELYEKIELDYKTIVEERWTAGNYPSYQEVYDLTTRIAESAPRILFLEHRDECRQMLRFISVLRWEDDKNVPLVSFDEKPRVGKLYTLRDIMEER